MIIYKYLLFIVAMIALSSTCFAKDDVHEINYENLIKIYMQNIEDDSSILDWKTGSRNGTPINWQHDGITECNKETEEKFGSPFCRTGKVVITDNGKPITEVLEQNIKPGEWQVELIGVANGFLHVTIESEILGAELPLETSKSLGIKKIRCDGAKPSDQGNQVYLITAKDKKPIYLNETWYCGAKSCTSSYVIYYDKDEAEKITCVN